MVRPSGAQRHIVLAVIAAACCARAAPAHARSSGTHFLAELDTGALLSGDSGPAATIAFGAGGKLRGFAPRLYLLGTIGCSEYEASPPAAEATWAGIETGTFSDLALGPRVYVPIFGPLRWFGEGLLGASYAAASYAEPGLASALQAGDWLLLGVVATGLQWRFTRALALGVRVAFSFNEAGLTGVARLAGVHDSARTTLALGATWHF
jgi:hypothetical protein